MIESSEKNKTKEPSLKNSFRTVFIRCDCDSEILVARYDAELDMLDLCLYENQSSFRNKMSWFQKLRYIYNVLRRGFPYTDQIILQRKQIEELRGFLTNL